MVQEESANGNRGGVGAPLRVLVVAFACCPPSGARFSGGEDLLGWRLVQQIGRYHRGCVLTDRQLRPDIEAACRQDPLPSVSFEYVGLPRWLEPMRRLQGSVQLYAYLWQVRAYFAARRLARRIPFDLAHHLTYANDWMASFIGALLPVPYVRGPGGGAHRIPAAFLQEFDVRGRVAQYLRSAGQWCLRRDPFFRRGQARAVRLLVCNREAWNALPTAWREKALLYPVNGISDEELTQRGGAEQPSGRTFRVLSAGKLLRLKGFSLAIKAFRQIAHRCPGAELEIIGDGPDRAYLQRLVASFGLSGRVRLLPWRSRTDFLAALRACDVFLFPSLRDGGGAVVVEALAAGKPVVCLQLGGPALHVTPECGMAVQADRPARTIAALAEALTRLYDDATLRMRMGHAARRRAEEHYHWDRLGDQLHTIYLEVLEGSRLGGTPSAAVGAVPSRLHDA